MQNRGRYDPIPATKAGTMRMWKPQLTPNPVIAWALPEPSKLVLNPTCILQNVRCRGRRACFILVSTHRLSCRSQSARNLVAEWQWKCAVDSFSDVIPLWKCRSLRMSHSFQFHRSHGKFEPHEQDQHAGRCFNGKTLRATVKQNRRRKHSGHEHTTPYEGGPMR
jgi:hypothetical protein